MAYAVEQYKQTRIPRSVLDLCIGDVRRVAMIQIDLEKAFDRVKHDVLTLSPALERRGRVLGSPSGPRLGPPFSQVLVAAVCTCSHGRLQMDTFYVR